MFRLSMRNLKLRKAPSEKQLAEVVTCMFASKAKEESQCFCFTHSISRNCVFILSQGLAEFRVEEGLSLPCQDGMTRIGWRWRIKLILFFSLSVELPLPYQVNPYSSFGTQQNDHFFHEASPDACNRGLSLYVHLCSSPPDCELFKDWDQALLIYVLQYPRQHLAHSS